jgi:hypothetical protein
MLWRMKSHVTLFNVATEVRKALKGKKTKVDIDSLFHLIAPVYLEYLKAEESQAREQKGVDELERIFDLKDPR